MRQIKINKPGSSDSLLVPNSSENYWILAVTGDIDSNTNLKLEASIDKKNWFFVKEQNQDVVFNSSGALLVAAGLYYRLNVGNFSSEILFSIKPN